jgi:hypothetical protein
MEELTHAPDLRVAYVISPDKVVINKGSDDGVRQGQTFLFYAIGGNIKDPVTGENLGPLELIRGTGQVVHVQNRMSIVRSARQKPLYDRGAGFSSLGARTPAGFEDLPFDGIEDGDYGRPV